MNEVYTDLEHNNNTNIPTFASGAKRIVEGKEDYIETTSWLAMKRFAEYMTSKQTVYGRGNWKKGIPIESYEQSLMRHLQKYLANKYDGANFEPNEDHLAAAMFNLMGILHEEQKSLSTFLKVLDMTKEVQAAKLGISVRTLYRRLKEQNGTKP